MRLGSIWYAYGKECPNCSKTLGRSTGTRRLGPQLRSSFVRRPNQLMVLSTAATARSSSSPSRTTLLWRQRRFVEKDTEAKRSGVTCAQHPISTSYTLLSGMLRSLSTCCSLAALCLQA